MILEFMKTRKSAKTPTRANPSDAGLDVYFCPEDGESVNLKKGENRLFQTGLKFGVPHGYMLEVKNRSGNAAKRHLLVGACVVDSGYDGEVFINLHNIGQDVQVVQPGERIAQAVLIPVIPVSPVEYEWDDLYSRVQVHSNRGDGALGSTDE